MTEPIERPQDLAGRTIGPTDVSEQEFWSKDLKMISLQMPMPEAYSAMEQGLLDVVVGAPLFSCLDMRWQEVAKYYIDHDLLRAGSVFSLMSLDAWNKLPKHLQDLFIEEHKQLEYDAPLFFEEKYAKARVTAREAGVQFIKFSPEDAKWFLETEHKRSFERALRLAPEDGPKLKALITK